MPHIRQKIGNQRFHGRKDIPFLTIPDMPMIALTALIIVTDQALARVSVEQAVFESVRASRHRLGNSPDSHFNKGTIRILSSIIERSHRLHMAHYAIGESMASSDIPLPNAPKKRAPEGALLYRCRSYIIPHTSISLCVNLPTHCRLSRAVAMDPHAPRRVAGPRPDAAPRFRPARKRSDPGACG